MPRGKNIKWNLNLCPVILSPNHSHSSDVSATITDNETQQAKTAKSLNEKLVFLGYKHFGAGNVYPGAANGPPNIHEAAANGRPYVHDGATNGHEGAANGPPYIHQWVASKIKLNASNLQNKV